MMEKKKGRITGYFKNYFGEVRNKFQTDCYNGEWRRREDILEDESDEFLCVMKKLLKKEIPMIYVEHLEELKDIAKEYFKYAYNAKVVVGDATGYVGDELNKVFLMDLKQGVIKADIQHGGGYGMINTWSMDDEYDICDVFFTCGWETNDIKKTKFEKMPYIKAFRLKTDEIAGEGDILYVGYSAGKNIFRLHRHSITIDKYLEAEVKFLSLIKREAAQELRIRLYSDCGWNHKSRIQREVGEFTYDTISDFSESVLHSKLCICGCFHSTPLEALLCNRPILILQHPRESSSWDGTPLDEEIERLVEADIIAGTPEKLAEIVNQIYDDVETWWNEPHRQEAINLFKEKYLYFPENAADIWIDKIASLAE